MSDTKYCGWRNRMTWLYNLWIRNERSSVEYWLEKAAERYEYYDQCCCDKWDSEHPREAAIYDLANDMEEDLEDWILDRLKTPDLLQDMIMSAKHEIDFFEVAEGFITDYLEDMKL